MYDCVSVYSNTEVAKPYYQMILHHPEMANQCKPGQFVMVTPYSEEEKNNTSLFLKRAISIYDVDKKNGWIYIYYQVMGAGTEHMTSLTTGDKVMVLGPQGRGFKTNVENEKILLVGAGVGIAPLKYLYDTIKDNNEVHCVFSGRDAAAIKYVDSFKNPQHLYLATDDGSIGKKSNVIELMEEVVAQQETPFTFIFSCGPPIVLKKVGIFANEQEIPGQLSLENRMACAVRACQACTIITKMGPQKVCGLGPVFDIKNLIMEAL